MPFLWKRGTACHRFKVAPVVATSLASLLVAAHVNAARHKDTSTTSTTPTVPLSSALELSGAPPMPSYSANDSFSFGVVGNSAPPAPNTYVPTTIFRIYDDLSVIQPDMLFHTGDFIWAAPSDQSGAQDQLTRFTTFTSTLKIPIYIAPGSKDIPDEDADVAYRKTISGGKPWRSFDYGNSHFVVLDSEVPDQVGKIGGDQLTWLKSDLDAHQNAGHTFVFVHRTAYPGTDNAPDEAVFASDDDRDTFTNLMAKYHVNTVFSGGIPSYIATIHDGVRYVNTGGGGGPTTIPAEDGGFLHYLLVRVDGANVSITPLQPGRIDIRMSPNPTDLGVAQAYNLTSKPLVLSRVGLLVPIKWRAKRAGLLGSDRLRVYDVTATVDGADGHKAVDVAPVDVEDASASDPLQRDFDILYVRVQAPADSAITIRVKPSS